MEEKEDFKKKQEQVLLVGLDNILNLFLVVHNTTALYCVQWPNYLLFKSGYSKITFESCVSKREHYDGGARKTKVELTVLHVTRGSLTHAPTAPTTQAYTLE